ncbi:Rieske 2Fe-2S domain-containing protein [Nitrogeniibacter mangrovi]|uniref:Rieske 2Fe-2S domain-containing protein n=1 Tax=Nitrogeniibacter mangrovi TaxID=2016596 RepID=A0A6C1B1Z2_9RHOO|nr:Rieske 2Fe-2S domain-containing protein [Nitrogeniibacter mangrovi]QID17646.1 Rieske 2Fe-2S domain-containing protein [Nitrogeniibacter mangrovi]
MFLKNAWYCAGWGKDLSMAREELQTRRIAGEALLLYRDVDGKAVVLEDRCCHRQAALSCGKREQGGIRCMYHGWLFESGGKCIEIPGMEIIPDRARVRAFPVVERDGWIWVWMGDADKADPDLICFAVGPDDPDWLLNTGQMSIKSNYRLEIANLADLTHLAWTHDKTFGGTRAYADARIKYKLTKRGMNYEFWMRDAPAFNVFAHLFPEGMRFDFHFDVQMTLPCNFVMRFRSFTAGTVTEGESDGELLLDTYTCQAVTPRDEGSLDYYYSWGPHRDTQQPGITQSLMAWAHEAFLEDKQMLEAQYLRVKEKPDHPVVDYIHDAGPGKLLWLLDKLIDDERTEDAEASSSRQGTAFV